ncbi:uncharacterized protein [Linepithema humile]|uniref:uncharacterized protein n=1 Tax=Linepithema humile TaxID=83485 RepID=UPI00351F720E
MLVYRTTAKPGLCFLPINDPIETCLSVRVRYRYDSTLDQCKDYTYFFYCGENENSFDDLENCEHTCTVRRLFTIVGKEFQDRRTDRGSLYCCLLADHSNGRFSTICLDLYDEARNLTRFCSVRTNLLALE